MPVDKQVRLRHQVLNKCFRDLYRNYTIDDLVEACNAALRRADKPEVSKRTIQNDIITIAINVKINRELISQILSFGSDIEVIAPANLRAEIKKIVSAMGYTYHVNE